MIIEQYIHTLIPNDPQFSPAAGQVTRLLDDLIALGAAPLNHKPFVLKSSGRLRSYKDPVTGETKSFPAIDRVALESTADLPSVIGALQEYYVALQGEGPPSVPLFPLYSDGSVFTEAYSYTVGCSLRPEPVSMSDLGDEHTGSDAPRFGSACSTESRTGMFRHPVTGELIEVPSAGCARFWVEFEFGQWLLPNIASSLDIINPKIIKLAVDCLGVPFAQGFHHY